MKFSEMPYERPDLEALKQQLAVFTERLQTAADYPPARAVFPGKRAFDEACFHVVLTGERAPYD